MVEELHSNLPPDIGNHLAEALEAFVFRAACDCSGIEQPMSSLEVQGWKK